MILTVFLVDVCAGGAHLWGRGLCYPADRGLSLPFIPAVTAARHLSPQKPQGSNGYPEFSAGVPLVRDAPAAAHVCSKSSFCFVTAQFGSSAEHRHNAGPASATMARHCADVSGLSPSRVITILLRRDPFPSGWDAWASNQIYDKSVGYRARKVDSPASTRVSGRRGVLDLQVILHSGTQSITPRRDRVADGLFGI